MPLTFRKSERLSGRNSISRLMQEGDGFFIYPYRIYALQKDRSQENPGSKVALAVPKKKFRKAHQRNTLKRQMREAYRTSPARTAFKVTQAKKAWDILIILAVAQAPDWSEHQKGMAKLLQKLTALSGDTQERPEKKQPTGKP